MRVALRCIYESRDLTAKPGQIVDLIPEEAQRLLDMGVATLPPDEMPAPEIDPSEDSAPRRGRSRKA